MPKCSKKIRGIAVILLTTAAVAWGYSRVHPSAEKSGDSRFREAPQFDLKDPHEISHALKSLRGKLTLVHFWASWCPPCLGELPQLVSLARELKGRPFQIVLISVDERWQDALKILPGNDLPENMLSVLDPGSRISDEYGTYQYPESYLVSPAQRVLFKWVGPQNWNAPQLEKLLNDPRIQSGI